MKNIWNTALAIMMSVILSVGIIVKTQQPKVIYQSQMSSDIIDSLVTECYRKDTIIMGWENHAVRMKRIVGLPDTVAWSYKQKVIHNISTQKCLHNLK